MGSARTRQPSGNTICYGEAQPLPRPVPLHAGPLHLNFEAGTLRNIYLGDVEILKQIYFAVRDPSWLTVAGATSKLRIDRKKDAFLIRYRSTHRAPPVHFVCDVRIEGTSTGGIRFEVDGVARSTFARARIGLCVLHPAERLAGVACEVLREETEQAVFPIGIDAAAPASGFHSMRGMNYRVTPDVQLQLRFTGDLFEMEDQRNWTDASFKTFSTPLHLPIPVTIKKGSRIRQSAAVQLVGRTSSDEGRHSRKLITLNLGTDSVSTLPAIGLGVASDREPLTSRERARLESLNLDHLRVDLDLGESNWKEQLSSAGREARALRPPLEIAILNHGGRLPKNFHIALHDSKVKVARWLLFPDSTFLALQLKRTFPGAQIGSGTNANFVAFNEHPPRGRHLDLATFAIHPQTHATDNSSLVETLEIQKTVALQARQLAGGLPIVVSPVTLKPRFNPDATGPEPPPAEGALPSQVDARQMSLFGAAWTLGSLKYLAEAGVESVTYYETAGWRGLMERRQGSQLPELFPSMAGAVFPLYFVFAWLAPFRRAKVLPLVSDSPLEVAGLAARKGSRTRILLANFTGSSQLVDILGLGKKARVVEMNEDNTLSILRRPDAAIERQGRAVTRPLLAMARYSVAKIDL